MRTISFCYACSLPPRRVLEAAHDFTGRRSKLFPAVEAEHFEVHSIADEHADVTEGTGTGMGVNWERCRYDWSHPGSVTAEVTHSNVYAPGSSWTITAIAAPHGSQVCVTWARHFIHTNRGRLFGTAFRIAARPIFRTYASKIIDNLETLEGQRSDANLASTPDPMPSRLSCIEAARDLTLCFHVWIDKSAVRSDLSTIPWHTQPPEPSRHNR
jgi:hypothetical protein